MKRLEGGVTAAKGFQAAGIYAGIKKNNKSDMAMVYSEVPCIAAGTFTTNLVKAAPVKWDQKVVKESDSAQAIVVNSGVANACTGEEGYQSCMDMAKKAGEVLSIPQDAVLVASTGVIGKQLPMDIILNGIEKLKDALGDKLSDGTAAAEAIMTTDTISKQTAFEFEIGGKKVVLGGMCKGSGMIHPNMATMLCFITTDIAIEKSLLQEALSEVVKDTFNMISVDGDTSTNDSVLLLANGRAENELIREKGNEYEVFKEVLNKVMTSLSKKIAGDGEGATALLEVKVVNAKTKEQAIVLSKSVITSNLTKAAIFGHDANWGRILCAMGYSGAEFQPDKTDIYFESAAGCLQVVKNGMATDYSEGYATKILSEAEVFVIVDIKEGEEMAIAWGCDLTYDYVKINADYRS
ncbi:MAG: bifunctional glutamate N-acetyltransferase/amino-acid acetyltransferase ArgJ [Lachnospiraceae bacterium]|nr:bifunctional glutamate N-acetyltransferase/amino-acid acetyltransferase ArgJ [Lachnospiraceae bacterium]